MEENDQSKTEICRRKDFYSLGSGLVQEKEHFDGSYCYQIPCFCKDKYLFGYINAFIITSEVP